MSVDQIILGLLRDPSTGYDIKKSFDSVFSNFWAAEQSQIYRTLKSLETQGLVRCKEEPSSKGPVRKVYRRTTGGRRVLTSWLEQEPDFGTARIPYLAQVYFLYELDDLERTAKVLRDVEGHFESRLELLRDIEAEWQSEDPSLPETDEDFHLWLVLQHGLLRTKALRDWAQIGLHALARRQRIGGSTNSGAKHVARFNQDRGDAVSGI